MNRPIDRAGRVGVAAVITAALTMLAVPALSAGFDVLLTSAAGFDPAARTITLPLHMGMQGGNAVWYIVTESSDRDDARVRGVNWAPKLANALGTAAVQRAVRLGNGIVDFAGTVDFGPERLVAPGPEGFPPAAAFPGSVGEGAYSPLATTDDGIVLNAPHVANATGRHDRVVGIDFEGGLVTLALTPGLYHGKEILYISTESSDFGAAALEEATWSPNLDAAPGIASNDPTTSARSSIVPIVNGERGAANPERQGLQSALLGEGSPLNITVIHPRNRGFIPTYSPLWDVHPAVWTAEAIAAGERKLLDHHEDVKELVRAGFLASGGAGPANADLGGLRAAGFIVNCPIMALE